MRVLSVMGFSSYWGEVPVNVLDLEEGPTVGGGEEATIRTAAGLRELGHEVTCFWYGRPGVWRGVQFKSRESNLYGEIANGDYDAVIGWSTLAPLEAAPKGTVRIFAQQLNDLFTPGDWSKVDCIVSPSRNHADQTREWGWRGPVAVVHNGLDPELYQDDGVPRTPWWERPHNVGYWSSPDRGLHHLLRAWPIVVKMEPTARLNVFYEIRKYLSFATSMIGMYGERARDLERLLNAADPATVTVHGQVTRKRLAKYQLQTRVHCYPYDPFQYCEGFAGAVNQGLAAGCLVMTTPKDALPSLYGDAIHWLRRSFLTPDYYEWLASQIVDGIHGVLPDHAYKLQRGPQVGRGYSWANAAVEMDAAIHRRGWSVP